MGAVNKAEEIACSSCHCLPEQLSKVLKGKRKRNRTPFDPPTPLRTLMRTSMHLHVDHLPLLCIRNMFELECYETLIMLLNLRQVI